MLSSVANVSQVPTLFPNGNIASSYGLPTYSKAFQDCPVSRPIVPLPKQSVQQRMQPFYLPCDLGKTSKPIIPIMIQSPTGNPNINSPPASSIPIGSLPTTLEAKINKQQFTPKLLIQSIPVNSTNIGSDNRDNIIPALSSSQAATIAESSIPGPIRIDNGQYKSNELIIVSEPNISSDVNNDAATLRIINSVPYIQSLPAFVYQKDPITGHLTRYLAMEDDKSYNTDTDYGINQEWLLFQRQGDQYDRTAEWNRYPEITDAEEFNMSGVTTLNEGRVWMGPPRTSPIDRSEYYDEYKRYLEYSQTQIQEEDS